MPRRPQQVVTSPRRASVAAPDVEAARVLGTAVTMVPIDTLLAHPRNPNVGNLDALVDSMRVNGFYGALIVQRSTGFILAGNHRWQAAQRLGYTELPVIYVDVDDERARRILVADNRTAELAHRDPAALLALLDDIHASSDGLAGVGFGVEDLDELRQFAATPDPAAATARAANQDPTPGTVRNEYRVLVTCADEREQAALYEELVNRGHACRLLL